MKPCEYKKFNWIVLALGVVSIALGLVMFWRLPESEHAMSRFAGMLSGFGCGILGVAIFRTIYEKVAPKEKLEQRRIEKQDERNIELTRMSYAIVATSSVLLFVVFAFVFAFIGQVVASWMCIGAIYVEVLVFFVSYRIFSKKM